MPRGEAGWLVVGWGGQRGRGLSGLGQGRRVWTRAVLSGVMGRGDSSYRRGTRSVGKSSFNYNREESEWPQAHSR